MLNVSRPYLVKLLDEGAIPSRKPVEKTFDRFYSMTQQEVEQKLKEAEAHQDEDAITSRLFQWKEELTRLRRIDDNLLVEHLEEAINQRNVT